MAITGATQYSSLNGFFYEIYDKIVDPIPDSAKFMKAVPFKGGALELGNKLHVNVVVSDEGGFTYAGTNDGAFAVNAAVTFLTQDAQVDAFQLLLQSSIDYESAARGSSSRKAFLEVVGKKLQVMVASTKRRYESELLYGQSTNVLGTISAKSGSTVTITLAEWAPQLWIGKTNQKISFYAPGGAERTTGNGATGYTIQSVNLDTRVITLTAAVDASVLVGDVISWTGSYGAVGAGNLTTPKTCMGAFAIASNSGTMFNINAANYDVWRGNLFDITAQYGGAKQYTFGRMMDSMATLANRGVEGAVDVWVSNLTWSKLATDQAALRRYKADVKSAKNGSQSIEFSYQTGGISIKGHGMIKQGYALVTETSKWKRIGAQDFSFKTPGLEEGKDIFWHDPSNAGFSYRYYGAQSLFCEVPSHQMLVSNIDNATP